MDGNDLKNAEINQFYHYWHSSTYAYEGHRHREFEISIILEGELEVTCMNRVYSLTKNRALIIPPYAFHRCHVVGGKTAEMVVFHFTSYDLTDSEPFFFELDEPSKSVLMPLIVNMETYATFGKYDALISYHGNAKKLFEVFLSYISIGQTAIKAENISNNDAYIYKKIVSYMYNNINRQLTINDIIKEVNIGKTAVERIFKRYTGYGCIGFFNDLKLDYASKLLREGESCSEVSEKLGYSSQSYFSRSFKRRFNISPSEVK